MPRTWSPLGRCPRATRRSKHGSWTSSPECGVRSWSAMRDRSRRAGGAHRPHRARPGVTGSWLFLGLILGLLLAGAAAPAAPAAAAPGESPRCFGALQYDLDGNSRPDLTVLDCAFATERDFVYVYDGADSMRLADRWQDAG